MIDGDHDRIRSKSPFFDQAAADRNVRYYRLRHLVKLQITRSLDDRAWRHFVAISADMIFGGPVKRARRRT
jgi:predicted alpha-1,6-mannanase (GH76 family)